MVVKEAQYIDHFMKIDEVVVMTRFSRAKIYRLIKKGDFPAQRKIGVSARWLASEVREWMAAQATLSHKRMPDRRRIKMPKAIKRRLLTK
ncbi:AlpA family phage regulatory protein [Seohaeicola saemankumensis]|uniref:helix-turn-helix transcriptional regulator n=1 Tax=Seohaeicola saemankumensis TaxID=481181 RepID=UPI001E441EE2|nr:AlpA family phage regulatory protein [Seohaeicola saemankumensis]MCD1625393.1 AlpA family phage regulatory protein [Seohaeicola saemankumensis]